MGFDRKVDVLLIFLSFSSSCSALMDNDWSLAILGDDTEYMSLPAELDDRDRCIVMLADAHAADCPSCVRHRQFSVLELAE